MSEEIIGLRRTEKQITKRLGEILVDSGAITSEQLKMALADQKKSGGLVGEILVGWGFTSEEEIVQALASQYAFPYIEPSIYAPNDDVIRMIPKDFAVRNSVVGLDRFGSVLTVAMANPLHQQAIEQLEQMTQCKVQAFITTYSEILRTIERQYQIQKPGSM